MAESRYTSKVLFFFLAKSGILTNRRLLKKYLPSLFEREKKRLQSLSVIFCSDEYLLRINQQYLKHEDLTDIITFDLSETGQSIVGEIYISIDRIKDNAHIFNTSFTDEIHRVIFHGCLHLCGYSDKTKRAQAIIREKENDHLRLYARLVSRETRST